MEDRVVRLSGLGVGNFRCFPARTTIRLAPLTLLYGWNNVGKSALLRLLAMVGEGVTESAAAPLDPGALGAAGGGFRALRWKGNPDLTEQAGILLRLEWEDAPVRAAEYIVDYDDRRNLSYLRALTVEGAGHAAIRYEANPTTQGYDRVEDNGARAPVSLRFVGLVPDGVPTLDPLREQLVGLRGRVQWLSSVRVRPPRFVAPTGAAPRRLQPDGQGALEVLLTDDTVRRRVVAWYDVAVKRALVLTDALQGGHKIQLRPKGTTMDVDLLDSGEGMAQCLPVVTAAAMMEQPWGARVLAVEEPESHLHPRAQRELAGLLCEVARHPSQPTVVAETHSFALMLGVQIAIAQGKIPAEAVVVYWLEAGDDGISSVREVRFDGAGRPLDPRPLGVFAVETDLAQDLADLRASL